MKKPTIEELEKLLDWDKCDGRIQIQPDGSIKTVPCPELVAIRTELDEAKRERDERYEEQKRLAVLAEEQAKMIVAIRGWAYKAEVLLGLAKDRMFEGVMSEDGMDGSVADNFKEQREALATYWPGESPASSKDMKLVKASAWEAVHKALEWIEKATRGEEGHDWDDVFCARDELRAAVVESAKRPGAGANPKEK